MSGPLTHILNAIETGDTSKTDELLPLVYAELRSLAAARLAREGAGQTLQATALVHEAYLRLLGPDASQRWQSSGHFFGAAAEAMRRILIDRARARGAAKRGAGARKASCDLDALPLSIDETTSDLLDLDEAISALGREDAKKAELVRLRFYAGLTLEQAGRVLGLSPATADRHWAYIRAWLFDRLSGGKNE